MELNKFSADGDLGSVMRTLASKSPGENTYVCPFPRSWYSPESPCSQSDDVITGAPLNPLIAPEDKAKLKQAFGDLLSFPNAKAFAWLVVALLVLWLGVKGLEAYAAIKNS